MEHKIISSSEKELWDNFIASSAGSPLLQSYGWGEFKSNFGWEPLRIAVLENSKIVAAISVLKKRNIFYAPRGPVLDFKDAETFDFLLQAVRLEAKKHRVAALKIDPFVEEERRGVAQLFKVKGFVENKIQIQPRSTIILDLDKDLDTIFENFESKTRYNIRLAEKKGVKVKKLTFAEGLEIFYQLHAETSRREKFLVQPLSYYQKLKLGEIFVAYYDSLPLASIFLLDFGNCVWYLYGASSREHKNLMANQLIHWEAIKWAKERGFKHYDFWGIPSNPAPAHPLFGVYRFKKGFGGRVVKLIGVYDLPFNKLLYYGFEQGVRIYKNLRSLLTKGKIEDSLRE